MDKPLLKHPLLYIIAAACLVFGYLVNFYASNQSTRLCDVERQLRTVELTLAVVVNRLDYLTEQQKRTDSKVDKLLERREADGYIR